LHRLRAVRDRLNLQERIRISKVKEELIKPGVQPEAAAGSLSSGRLQRHLPFLACRL